MRPRKQIRDALKELATTRVTSAKSIVIGRPQMKGSDECLAAFLYSVAERPDDYGLSEQGQADLLAPETERTYELRFAVIGSETGDAEDEIDDVISEFEFALNEDQTLSGVAESVSVTAVLWSPSGDTAAARVAAELQITATYRATAALTKAL